jgi:cleavage stimulation factor subunit 3
MIDDRSREFMSVRKIAKDYENVTRYLDRSSPSLPPQGTPDELKQKSHWKKYVEWEKGNPLKTEDIAVNARRGINITNIKESSTNLVDSFNVKYFVFVKVMFAYEQWLLAMPNHPDIYYEAASYLQQMSSLMAERCDAVLCKYYANEATNLYERAIQTFMRTNLLTYFAFCDFEEVINTI